MATRSKSTNANLRRDALRIFRAALAAADPAKAIAAHIRVEGDILTAGKTRYDLRKVGEIYLIGAGKAGAPMASAVERLLGTRIKRGLINVKYGHTAKLKFTELNECAHPVPDEKGVEGATRIASMLEETAKDDLVICVISGGGSALLPLPAPGVTLADKQEVTSLLLKCAATIHEINAVRKHLSAIKGGQLARAAYPARVLTLILSDVVGDDLDVIGSGPTSPDSSSYADAIGILKQRDVWQETPARVRQHLERGERSELPETPKRDDPAFSRTQNLIVGSNELALRAAEAEAGRLGYKPLLLSSRIEGEAKDIAMMHCAIAKEVKASGKPVRPPACIISGGETTVTVRGDGKGGRNTEFVLASALAIQGIPGITVLSAGTDGSDGPTDAAGGICDGASLTSGSAADAIAALRNNDSYTFLDRVDGLVRTGPTGTNVMDVRLLLVT